MWFCVPEKLLLAVVLTCVTGCVVLGGTLSKKEKKKKKKGKAWKSLPRTQSCFTTMKLHKFPRKRWCVGSDVFLAMAVVCVPPDGAWAR